MPKSLAPNEQRTIDRHVVVDDLRAIEQIYLEALETVDSALKHINHIKYPDGTRQAKPLIPSDLGTLANLLERMIWSDRQLLAERQILFHETGNRISVGWMTQEGGQE